MPDDEAATSATKTVVTTVASVPPPRFGASQDACLVVIYGEDLGRRVPLGPSPLLIGRASACELQIDQESVSRNHCRITLAGKTFRLTDLGSTNGTYLNDEPIRESELRDGDQIKVGRTILKFILSGNIEAMYHEEIYRLMTVDGLTQLHNKRYFDESLEREISRSGRYGRSFSLILFDIDHFKRINDTHGHLAGDAVLRRLGVLIRDKLRRDDTVARTGGEEFGVVLPEVGKETALEVAEKLRKLIEKTRFEFEGLSIPVTVSLGVAEWKPAYETAANLVKVTDEHLYEAKRTGRNRTCG